MELQHFSHSHPLIFNEDSDHKSNCSGCGELVSGPNFSCMACGFYLDKDCAKAPSELAHPFHRDHNLNLLNSLNLQKHYQYRSGCFCDFCYKNCENFVYHCSCNLDLHIKCALFLYNIAEKKNGELQIAHIDPLISIEVPSKELKKAECFACWKPLLDSAYLSIDSGFCVHKKCVEVPLEVNHLFHPQHSLFLQFNSQSLPCQICKETQDKGFVYCCSPCQFVLHIACAELPTKINHLCHRDHPVILQLNPESLNCQICQETHGQGLYFCSLCKFTLDVKCVSQPPTIKGEIHEHPFTLFWRQVPFICDACGTEGNFVSYICSTCSLIVHQKCISLPRIIRLGRHHHPISHTFILGQHEIKSWECKICPKEVNARHGSYCCSDCNYIVHTNCAKVDSSWYIFGKIDERDEQFNKDSAFSIVKEAKVGKNVIPTEIKHLSHQHNLVLSDDVKDEKVCDGCMLMIISTTFYYCSECNFFLHKSCAESPRKIYIWSLKYQYPYGLIFDQIFLCNDCEYEFNSGFAYSVISTNVHTNYGLLCLRCALMSDTITCRGHEHSLTFYDKYEGQCRGCGDKQRHGFACKDCNFLVDSINCLNLPDITRHKCDEHPLILTYGDENVYSEYNYCDICEERRNPDHWFYHCVICDNSVHPKCAIGRYSFMKLGVNYTKEDHPHPLTCIQKVYDYSYKCHECGQPCLDHECGQPCLDVALECVENGCNYIVHWKCVDEPSTTLKRLK